MSEMLHTLSEALAGAVESIGESVVRVEARRRLPATGIVWSADGVIVTSSHVVKHDNNITVGLPNGERVAAALVGRDTTTDLAVLKAEAAGLKPPIWADAALLKVGQLVLALGKPGKTVQATLGVINTLSDAWRAPAGGHIDRYVQTDVTMYPGFSGGPLVGARGEVIGLNTSRLLHGASITLPAPTLARVVNALLEHGHIKRGYLGVGTQPVRLPQAAAEELEQETGLLLVSVEAGGPADQGGLLTGDIIVRFGGEATRHRDALLAYIGGDRVGKTVEVGVVRGGEFKTFDVTIGERA